MSQAVNLRYALFCIIFDASTPIPGTVPKRLILARKILTILGGWASKPLGKFNSGKEATHAKIIRSDVD